VKVIYSDGGRKAAGFKGKAKDCVCRAIAIATEQPYSTVYDALHQTKRSMRQTKNVRGSSPASGVSRVIYERYLRELGWEFVPTMRIGSGCKVHLRDGELPKGRLIARCSGHLCAVIDGVVYDQHDPTRGGTRCVYGYYIEKREEQ
jgi:hypothetical protein